jgi:ABC-type Fe3+-siderophore transport system permease subunit
MPAFNLQAAFPLGLLARDMANRLAEGPDMALRVPSAIGAVPIKLVGRLLNDHRAGRPCASAVGVAVHSLRWVVTAAAALSVTNGSITSKYSLVSAASPCG